MADVKGMEGGNFRNGDRVSHKTFGSGRVTEVEGDFMTVNFADVGSKKLMVKLAPLVLLSRGPRPPNMPTAAKVKPEATQSWSPVDVVSVRQELLSHAQALHKRYDAKPRAVEEATKDSLRSRMQAHLEKLRDGKRPDDAPIAHPGVTQGGPLGLPEAITLAGVTFEGRQMNLARANVGDVIRLVRRPENAFDPNAVEVLTVDGASLGWVPKTQAKLIAPHLDAGTAIHGKILSVAGNLDAGYNLGASVSLITENFGGGTKQGIRSQSSASIRSGHPPTPRGTASSRYHDGNYHDGDYDEDYNSDDDYDIE